MSDYPIFISPFTNDGPIYIQLAPFVEVQISHAAAARGIPVKQFVTDALMAAAQVTPPLELEWA